MTDSDVHILIKCENTTQGKQRWQHLMSNHIPKEKVPDDYTCLGILKQNEEKKKSSFFL